MSDLEPSQMTPPSRMAITMHSASGTPQPTTRATEFAPRSSPIVWMARSIATHPSSFDRGNPFV
jgi:hypothetical protein